MAFVALGLWLWKSSLFVQPRELYWQLGEDRAIQSVEIQIWSAKGELLKREVFSFAEAAPPELVQKLPLAQGNYLARVFIRRAAGRGEEPYEQSVRVGRESSIVLSLRGSHPRR